MQRRDFIKLVGSTTAWPLAARAQRIAVPVVGLLGGASPDRSVAILRAFREGLGETGYVENRNVKIEYRWALGQNNQLPELAADSPPRNRYRHARQHASGARRKGGHHRYSHCLPSGI
jgi:putative tryptophan/tyrosine transport system substrate-binding protein